MKEPLMSGSGILWAYFELIYERNPRVFSNSGSKVYWWVFFDQTLNKHSIYPLDNTPSAPSDERNHFLICHLQSPLRRAQAWRTVQDGSVLVRIGLGTRILGL